jgi:ATP/maltotriose-dependent transcriptional regulator MalT/DNA-binding SARP family transcriptional activator
MTDSPPRACLLLTAAAGYGKTTVLRRRFRAPGTVWHRGGDVDALIAGDLAKSAATGTGGDVSIVVDDLPRLAPETVRDLLTAIGELPDGVTVALSSRWPLDDGTARWSGRGRLAELGPAEFTLTADEVVDLLAAEYGIVDPDVADQLHELTGGWPALVHLAAETLGSGAAPAGPLLPLLAGPDTPLATYVASEVLAGLPGDVTRLIRDLVDLAPVSAGLCGALGHRRAPAALRVLTRIGLLVCMSGGPTAGDRLVPVIGQVVRDANRRTPSRRTAGAAPSRRIAGTAAEWYGEHGPPLAAARAHLLADAPGHCARVLSEHGDAVLAAGRPDALAALIESVPAALHTRRLRLLLGDALRTGGELTVAARVYDAIAAAEPVGDAGLAWRTGRVHYQRGDPRTALKVFGGGHEEPADADTAILLAWTAHAHLLAGDCAAATGYAERAVRHAADAGHDGALATAHVSVALCLGAAGDTAGSEEHYARALPIAERTGDVILVTRILINQSHHLLCQARYAEALVTARQADRYAAAAGYPNLRNIASCNQADALTMLGRYDEAVRSYRQVLSRYERMGSRRSGAALLGLGEVYRRRGWREQARAAYEEAVRVAESAGNANILVPALAGLALVIHHDEPDAAAQHADRAVREAAPEILVPALLARGWVALRNGYAAGTRAAADEASRIARGQRDRGGLADALELRAALAQRSGAGPDGARVRAALREAQAIWTDTGAVLEAARIRVWLGGLADAPTDDRLGALIATEELLAAGAVPDHRAAVPGAADGPSGGEVSIRLLGRFEVLLGDQVVAVSQWQSRKARELLRIVAARRGRPVPRGVLCELLWPDDDVERTGHRLSVLLSIVRGVLDPRRDHPADHYLVADAASIALDITRVRLDVEEFTAHVLHGRRLLDRGAHADARTVLSAAADEYRADVFEDEPYADWAAPLREEVRAAYLTMLRMLARAGRAAADPETAVTALLRLLEKDPYDEPAHRALVRTLAAGGRHGEARRAFVRYGEAMRAIGVRPPDESLLAMP